MPNDISEIATFNRRKYLSFLETRTFMASVDISLPSSNNEYEAGIYLAL